MDNDTESALDHLWREYAAVFRGFDDLTLARWMSQTLGQLKGRVWRLSHPLVGAYRLAAQVGQDREIWHKRLVTIPAGYSESACCGAPFLPLLTRDVSESGLICQHCGGTLLGFEDLPKDLQPLLQDWAGQYGPVHAVAHWTDAELKRAADYDQSYDQAAEKAESLLSQVGGELVPRLLEHYPAIVWEDQDECLDVRPEDIELD